MDSYPNYQRPPYDLQKSQYDDLDDPPRQYNGQANTLSPSHRRVPSYPLAQKSTDKLADASTDDLNPKYPPISARELGPPRSSLWHRIVPDSLACKLFVVVVLVETAIDLAIEGDLLIRLNEQTDDFDSLPGAARKMPIYLALFALAHVFQFVMAVDAVYARNTLQFMALILFNAAFLLYSIIQITELRTSTLGNEANTSGSKKIPIDALTTIIPIVISVSEIAFIALGWKIYNEFGWKTYKFLGADRRVKKMYANYQIFLCLVKFDVFFWAAFSVQFIWLVLKKDDWEYYVTCAALPLSIILLVEGHLAARHENKWMMAVFMSGCVAALVYFIYKLSRVLVDLDTTFVDFWRSLTIFSVLAIVLLITTFVFSILVLRNFGYGLKDALTRKDAQEHRRGPSQAPHQRNASTHLNRMSID